MTKINIYDDLQNQKSEKIEAIKKILPDCFDKDGNLIEGRLKEVLSGDFKKPDTERFTFNWAGKQKAREIAYKTYCDGTLKFDKLRSKNFDTTENLIIEGDNLQVLKLLKNSYKGKVKCIYIDPPYNTGNDFVYNDNFELDIKKYLIETGEIDEETGEQIADYIQKDDGKKHSKWLSFMYPRLMVAREMLQEDGVIFISIDDNEVHHLRLLMNEVFGEREFVGSFIRKTKSTTNDAKRGFNIQHEECLVYAKDIENLNLNGEEKTWENYKNPDNDPNGTWVIADPSARTGSFFEIKNPYTGKIDLPPENRQWQFSESRFKEFVANGKIVFRKEHKENERGFIFKRYRDEVRSDFHLVNSLDFANNDYMNQVATKENKNDFSGLQFDYPKPLQFIKNILKYSTQPNDLILDFFAGSGTTGQAVMELNQEEIDKQAKDGLFDTDDKKPAGGRKFILVQLPEKIDAKKEAFKAGYKKISDITIERVKRAGKKYKSVDNGFKVMQLADNPDRHNLWSLGNLSSSQDNNEFIFTHLSLIYGYGLNYKLEKIHEKEIYIMKSEFSNTKDAIVIMEEKKLTMDDILSLIKNYGKENYKFFSRDSALNIELTYNLLQHFKQDNVIVF